MPTLRVFNQITKTHTRLGFLKRLLKRVVSQTTSNLDNLGNDLVDVVSRKFKVPLTEERAKYIKVRLYDQAYKTLKEQTNNWLKDPSASVEVQMELQDLYLADLTLPSNVGKLVREDWRFYPSFGTNIGLIRTGTYSANTRALSLLHFISDLEAKAFSEYLPEENPLKIQPKQNLLFLYSLIENDGEVAIPFFVQLLHSSMSSFNDREAGNFLPDIYKKIISRYRMTTLPFDLRERIGVLEKSAEKIAIQKASESYEGSTSREHASRPRLEPYVDLGLFNKPSPMKYEYSISPIGSRWIAEFSGQEDSAAIEKFLNKRFFQTAAAAWKIEATSLTGTEEIVTRLKLAAKVISSSSGYSPIEELALLAGIDALVDDHKIIEIGQAREAIIAYQKANPYQVRFTVDRMGILAHAKFIDETSPRSS